MKRKITPTIGIFIVVLFSLAGCATNNADNQQTATSNQENTQANDKVTQLSQAKPTTIQTSNGEITINPTVISATDANLGEDSLAPDQAYYDPLEWLNRPIFTFNHYAYTYALIPLAKGYNKVVPDPVKKGVDNAFDNIREPLNLLNNALTGEFSDAGRNLGRFLINSTIGIVGLFDPASDWFDIKKEPKTFAETLMDYDVGSGAYIVLPLLGQSDLRGTTSIIGEGLIHPIGEVVDSPDDFYLRTFDGFDDFSAQADLYIELYESSEDPYLYFRNQHIQSTNRNELMNATPEETPEDENE
ncbi:MlaA family lipoprotein [Glaciecola sp. 1036]|uniref:MlaA family lipoprotein n=1 Tax=Alteromonadaceae TaxID=72275 RepID=UPI003CFE4103